MAFTDIDDSLSFGASIKGTAWGRAKDVVGLGFVTNGLSKDHRDFVAAGGLGILIGDGRLNYQRENVIEAYYAYALTDTLTLTLDYQFMMNRPTMPIAARFRFSPRGCTRNSDLTWCRHCDANVLPMTTLPSDQTLTSDFR
jgi:carbohydrate-selective porin OprB